MSEELRIGVFVCHCGSNIAGVVDCKAVADAAAELPGVVFVKENLYSCSETGTTEIKEAIRANRLNRVVVAACTPRTHEPTFRAACIEAGVNPYYFEMANIRDQDSWVHPHDKEAATKKAIELVRGAVARAALLEAQEPIVASVRPQALVIGGGPSGMAAAVNLARRGHEVHLVEREDRLGGLLNRVHRLFQDDREARTLVAELEEQVRRHENIHVHLNAQVKDLAGYIGNYDVTLETPEGTETLGAGVIVVATGAVPLVPEGMYGYDGERVITQAELEQIWLQGKALDGDRVVIIQCVGARCPDRPYCSKICCVTALKNAQRILEENPKAKVTLLYRDIQTVGVEYEERLRSAKAAGVRLVRYTPEREPKVRDGVVEVYHTLLGRTLSIPYDKVVLSTPLVSQPGAQDLARLLKVPLDQYGFFLEAHVKLRPLDFANDGIYLAGSGHWPVDVKEAMAQGRGAASRASIVLTGDLQVEVEPIVSEMADYDACRGCGLCAAVCPYGAIEIVDTPDGRKARMIHVACKGCGTCAATCYRHCIRMRHFTDEQITAQVAAILGAELPEGQAATSG